MSKLLIEQSKRGTKVHTFVSYNKKHNDRSKIVFEVTEEILKRLDSYPGQLVSLRRRTSPNNVKVLLFTSRT